MDKSESTNRRRPGRTKQLHRFVKPVAMASLFLFLMPMRGQPALDGSFTKLGGGGTWSGTGSLAVARYGHTATLLASGKVLVAGGGPGSSPPTSAELYDRANGTWSGTGSLLAPRREHTAILLPSGKVLVAGGLGDFSKSRSHGRII